MLSEFGGIHGVSIDGLDVEDDCVESDFGGFGAEGGDFLFAVHAAEVGGGVDPENAGLEVHPGGG